MYYCIMYAHIGIINNTTTNIGGALVCFITKTAYRLQTSLLLFKKISISHFYI